MKTTGVTINTVSGNINLNSDFINSNIPANHDFVYNELPTLRCKFVKYTDGSPSYNLNDDIYATSYKTASGIIMYRINFKSEESRRMWVVLNTCRNAIQTNDWHGATILMINKDRRVLNQLIHDVDSGNRISDTIDGVYPIALI